MSHAVIIAVAIAGAVAAGLVAYSAGLIPPPGQSAENGGNIVDMITSPTQNSSMTPDSTPMLDVVISYPTEGSTVRGTIEALVQVSGNVDVEGVEGHLDDTLVDTEDTAPYEFTIDTWPFEDGAHTFRATAVGSSMNATAMVNITVQNLVDIPAPGTYPPPVLLGGLLPTAEQVFKSETFRVPDEASNFIILIPNEAHHLDSEPETLIAETNAHYLPTNVEVSKATSIIFLNNDYDHSHTTVVTSEQDGRIVWETSNVAYAQHTESKSFLNEEAGTYLVVSDDSDYEDMRGTITVREPTISPTGATVGCIYVPQEDLPKFRQIFSLRGFAIESEHNFTWDNSNQDTDDQTLIIFSTMHPLSDALQQLAPIVEATPYD